jgi:hypothetical protein
VISNYPLHVDILSSMATTPLCMVEIYYFCVIGIILQFALDSLLDVNKHVDKARRSYAFCTELLSEYNYAQLSV